MGDTVKIRQLRPGERPSKPSSVDLTPRSGLERVVEDVKLALLTTGLSLQGERERGQDPYNSKPAAKTHDAWSDRNRRR